MGFFDGNICAAGTVGVESMIGGGATGADTIGGAMTLSGTFIKGNSLFDLNIFVILLLSTFSLSAFSFSLKIDGDTNSTGDGGGISSFSRSIGLILDKGKSSGFIGGFGKRGGIAKLGIAGWRPGPPRPRGNGNRGNIGEGIKPGAGGNAGKKGKGSVGRDSLTCNGGSGACGVFGRSRTSDSTTSFESFVWKKRERKK